MALSLGKNKHVPPTPRDQPKQDNQVFMKKPRRGGVLPHKMLIFEDSLLRQGGELPPPHRYVLQELVCLKTKS